ncbi:ribosome-inactivating family protein [Streptomyces sviceus]|uniref:ribosome-inactivating family protein n=1 Tax=Streptomyces sviceus TaxID=285530 RepID=UPI0036809879
MSTEIVVPRPPGRWRTRTSIATIGAVLLALCLTLLSPFGAGKAFAINDQQDVNWDISKGQSGYQQMIRDVRSRAEEKVIYGTSSETVWATENSTDYFLVNVYDGSNQLIRLVLNAHNLYVQGYYSPGDRTYYYFSDAALRDVNWLPSSSSNPNFTWKLPFNGSYLGMTRYAGQSMSSPTFSTDWARYNAQQLSYKTTADTVRAGALLWFVEAVAEGARFNAISDRIIAAWAGGSGYKFDSADQGLVQNWQSIGNNFQQRLDGTGVQPTPAIGRYSFSTIASTAAILYLAIWWSP